jgi:hypothetical protein
LSLWAQSRASWQQYICGIGEFELKYLTLEQASFILFLTYSCYALLATSQRQLIAKPLAVIGLATQKLTFPSTGAFYFDGFKYRRAQASRQQLK